MNPPRRTERPPDDDPPELTEDEIHWIREQRRQHQHEVWLRGQIRILWPWVVSVIGALVGAAIWIKEHVRL